ncbi:MAG: hypothetical protein PHI22_00775 [Bacilli bacterium]|nr:hypothetical protein [Bacilli bacterium]MDD4298192.1 hypothetical protein [Bacilli bacterium]
MLKQILKKVKIKIEEYKREREKRIEVAKTRILTRIYTPWTDEEVEAFNHAVAIANEGNCGGNWDETRCKINILHSGRNYFTIEEYDYHMGCLNPAYKARLEKNNSSQKCR